MKELAAGRVPPHGGRKTPRPHVPLAQSLLEEWLEEAIVLAEDWEALPAAKREEILRCAEIKELLGLLVNNGLLTAYQTQRVQAGKVFGLRLGNYRVLDRLGTGGMGVVFKAEHIRMRRQVAIKVLCFGAEQDPRLLRRFLQEIRAVAQLQHPNIVAAFDAGEAPAADGSSVLHFFVMEYVPGQDLEAFVDKHGPLSPAKACDLIHQIASALAEAHRHNLVHRDIKPSNIQVTPEGQAKLLDFGLARSNFSHSLTEPGMVLGTLDFIAPEQIEDSHTVDIRADLYGLGGVLYWCLTRQLPFTPKGNISEEMVARLQQPPPSVCQARPEVPAELDKIVQRLMARNPDDRFISPQEVMRALLPFLRSGARDHLLATPVGAPQELEQAGGFGDLTMASVPRQLLLVDDEPDLRAFCRQVLQTEGLHCDEASAGRQALDMLQAKNYDLVLLDLNLPDISGLEVCRQLRESPPNPNLKIIMASGNANIDTMANWLLSGADDFLTKPFSLLQLRARIKAALRLKEAQDRSEVLNHHLLSANHELELSLGARNRDLVDARNALVLALAKLVENRASETGAHLVRIQGFCRCLAEQAARSPGLGGQIDEYFLEILECCAPLHDIGKVGLPDHILHKPGKLDSDERIIMQAHTLIGAETLSEVARNHGSAMAFLQIAIDIVRHHHERYDGQGYPDRLVGAEIPLVARIVTIGDVYDALRSRRPYKPALSHTAALQVMSENAGKQFDPALMKIFLQSAAEFERIYKESPD